MQHGGARAARGLPGPRAAIRRHSFKANVFPCAMDAPASAGEGVQLETSPARPATADGSSPAQAEQTSAAAVPLSAPGGATAAPAAAAAAPTAIPVINEPTSQQPAGASATMRGADGGQPAQAAGPSPAAEHTLASGNHGGAAAPAGGVAMMQPTGPEEKHAQKPTWRRGYANYARTDYLFCTLTPSDCSSKRLRPPREPRPQSSAAAHFARGLLLPCGPAADAPTCQCHPLIAGEWYDSLLGANLNFVVGAQTADGTPTSFLLKAHACEQGSEFTCGLLSTSAGAHWLGSVQPGFQVPPSELSHPRPLLCRRADEYIKNELYIQVGQPWWRRWMDAAKPLANWLAHARLCSSKGCSICAQGGETKRMFKVLGLQPGDGVKLQVASRESGIPTLRLTVIPAGGPARMCHCPRAQSGGDELNVLP